MSSDTAIARAADFERRLLQLGILAGALVPILGGLAGVVLGPAVFSDETQCSASCDSHVRYLSGVLLGIGLAYWSLIPRIERQGSVFRTLTAIVMLGGLARAYSAYRFGLPPWPMTGALGMELVITPLLALWQARIARLHAKRV